jgi:hypothetical protein
VLTSFLARDWSPAASTEVPLTFVVGPLDGALDNNANHKEGGQDTGWVVRVFKGFRV